MSDVMPEHQSQLLPENNKFHKGNGVDGKHYWLTPPDLYAQLNADRNFDFDPCPFPKPNDFDGLTCEWGQSSYVNPPFGSIIHEGRKKGPTAWVRKAIAEAQKGKRVCLVYPVDKWVLMLLAAGAKVSNLGDVRWLSTEDGSAGKGTGRHIACFDLDGRADLAPPAANAGIVMTAEAVEKLHSVWNLLTNIRSLADRTDEVRHRAEVARDLIESVLPSPGQPSDAGKGA